MNRPSPPATVIGFLDRRPVPVNIATKVDARLVFLQRAAARLYLFEIGEMELGEAYDGLIIDLRCNCDCERVARWERLFPPSPIKRRKTFR